MAKTKDAAELVLRYLTARALFRQAPWDMPPNLEYLIACGVRLLPGGVLINEVLLALTPAIIDDRKDPMFWSAIIGGEESAIHMALPEQEQVREFILDGDWTLPVMPWEHRSLLHKIADLCAMLVKGRSGEDGARELVGNGAVQHIAARNGLGSIVTSPGPVPNISE
jgi:hypothetical protein